LVGVRRAQVERKIGELGKATARRRKEQLLAEAAKARHGELRREAKSVRDAERNELERGALTARDLVQGEFHRAGVSAKLSALAHAESIATARADRERTAEAKAKVELGRARTDEDIVLRHRGRFRAALEKKQEKDVEDASADLFTAVRRGARRR
jgi:hypothetical protein